MARKKYPSDSPEKKREYRERYKQRHPERVREQARQGGRRYRANPATAEKRREKDRRFREKLYADPERHAAFLEKRRMEHAARRMAEGKSYVPHRHRIKVNDPDQDLLAAPFALWLEAAWADQLAHAVVDHVGWCIGTLGIPDRRYRAVVNAEQKFVRLDTVDRAISNYPRHVLIDHSDGPLLVCSVFDLYPDPTATVQEPHEPVRSTS